MSGCCLGSSGATAQCRCKTGGLRMRSDWRREPARALGCVGGGGRAALRVQPRAAAAPAPAPRRAAHQAHGAALHEMCSHTIYEQQTLLMSSTIWHLHALCYLQLPQIPMRNNQVAAQASAKLYVALVPPKQLANHRELPNILQATIVLASTKSALQREGASAKDQEVD